MRLKEKDTQVEIRAIMLEGAKAFLPDKQVTPPGWKGKIGASF